MIVRTVRLRAHSAFSFPVEHDPVWEIDTPILTSAGNMVPACYDEWMRPVEGLSEEELVEMGVDERMDNGSLERPPGWEGYKEFITFRDPERIAFYEN